MNAPHFIALAAFSLLLAAVVCDLRTRTIPDSLSIALCTLGLLATWQDWHQVSFTELGMGMTTGLAIGAALFYTGVMGGGDAKLRAGLGAVCGWPNLLEVLFATALVGGLLSLLAQRKRQQTLAYAPAFAGGYAVTMALTFTLAPRTGLWDVITRSGL